MAEEQVIDDYYVSLQKGEIDSRARIGDLSKEELIDKLKENLNADLDQIAAQINSSGKDKWRNSTVKSTAQQNKHIRFSSPSDDEKENKEERLEKKQSPRKSNEKSPSPSKRNGGKKPFNNRKQSPSKPKKVIDYNQFEALNGAPRVNEIIAFQILEISSNFTPEVSDYKVGTVIDFDSKTNETTLQLHSEYNSILKRSNKFSIVFEETEDDEQLTYEDSPRSNRSNKEEEIIKVDWRNLMNIKLIPEGFDLKQLQDEDEVEEESEQKANGHKSEDESEEQVIDDYYETVKKVDRYNKNNTNKKTNCCGKQQQPQKQEAKPDQKNVKKQQEEKVKNDDLDRIASSVNSHAKAKWKNSAPSKAANSNAPKHIRFQSGSSSSSSCSSSSSSSSDSSSSNDDEEMRSANENKSKAKTNKNNQDRKEKVVPSKKSEQVVNKVKQLLTTASPDIKPNSSQVTKTKSPKTQSLKSIDSKNKTKEEEKEKEKPTVAIDTQTFMIQIGNVFELNSNSKEVTVKFNSNYKSEINLKITNKDQSDEMSEKKKKKKKEEKSPKVELDWKNSMNVKLIPNEISLNMKSQKEGEEEKEEDDDVKMKESDSSSNESESESESEEDEKEIVASKKSSNQKTANQNGSKRKINEPARQQKQTSQKVNEEKSNSKTTKTDSSSSKKATPTHIRFDSSSSDSSSSSSSCSSASSDSSTSSDSEDEPIERKPQPNLKSKQYTNQQQYNKPVAKKNQQQEASTSAAAKTSPQKQAKNTQQQEQQRNKYYQPSKEEQVNAISYNRAFLLQNPKDMSDFKKVFNQTKLNAPNPEEFLLKYDQDDQHPPELIIDEEEVLAQQQQQLIESATSQYQEPSSYQDQDQQTTDDQLQFLQEQQNAFVAPPKIDFTKFEPLSGVPNAEDKIAFQLLEISPNYTPEVSSYKVATVLGFDHNSGEITLKLDDNLLDKPSTSLVEGLDLLANGEFRPQQPKEDVLTMDWRNLMNIRLLPKAHL